MLIRCVTTFDITATGVRNNFNVNRVPFHDAAGKLVDNEESWKHSRNQQRNWETINQLISLRCLPHSITGPQKYIDDGVQIWRFEFHVDDPAMISDQDLLGLLKKDCLGTPMITGLHETPQQIAYLEPNHNILFEMDLS